MGWIDAVLLAVIIGAAAAVLKKMLMRLGKGGCAGCGGSCKACTGCAAARDALKQQ